MRNEKGVPAKQVVAQLRVKSSVLEQLSGPESIDAYGLEIYFLDKDQAQRAPKPSEIQIDCSNCG